MLSKITSWRHSKIIAFVLAVAVFLTAFYGLVPVISLAEATDAPAQQAETVGTWDGWGAGDSFETAFADQNAEDIGTESNPYKIYNGDQLYAAVHSDTITAYFVLMNDIQLQSDANLAKLRQYIDESKTGASTVDLTGLNEWASGTYRFYGNFEGNSHTVTGLYQNSTNSEYNMGHGLFSRLGQNAVVKNITLDGAYIKGGSYTGGIAGIVAGTTAQVSVLGCVVKNSKIENTYENITGDNYYFAAAGGIIGGGYNNNNSTTVENCAVIDTQVTNLLEDVRGGFFGQFFGNDLAGYVIKNSICIGDCIANQNAVRGASSNYYATSKGALANTTVLTEDMLGAAFYDITGLTPAKGWIVEKEDSYPVYVGTENALKAQYVTPVWNGNRAITVSNLAGKGTADEPYLISTGSELYFAVHSHDDGLDKHFEIMNDIQLQSDAAIDHLRAVSQGTVALDTTTYTFNSWKAGHSFKGTLLGNNHTIYGLYSKSSSSWQGLIGQTAGDVTVEGVRLEAAYISDASATSDSAVGGILARVATNGCKVNITGCSVKYSYLYGKTDAGGIVGIGYAGATVGTTCTIDKCISSNNTITGAINKGGLYCSNWQTVNVTVKDSICIGYKVYHGGVTSIINTYSDVSSTGVTVATADQLKGTELPSINASTGWEIKENAFPVYTGVIGTRPSNTTTVWNGIKITDFTTLDGEGTIDEPYLIYNGAELYAAVNCTTANTYFKLMNDIQLQSNDNMNELKTLIGNGSSEATFNSWLYKTSAFFGHIDGNFKTVSGLYLNGTTTGDTGLGFISRAGGGSSISNLTLDSMYITGINKIGGFIGLVYGNAGGVNISGCVLKNSKLHNTSTSTDSQYNSVAGIVAGHWSGGVIAIENCSVYDVELISDVGTCAGMTGNNIGTSAAHTNKNSISVGYKPSANTYVTHTNVYTTAAATNSGVIANLTQEQLQGEDVLLAGIRPLMGWEFAEGEYPKYTGKQGKEPTNSVTYWNGVKPSALDEYEGIGTGTEDDPILIRHGFELYAALQNTEGKHFKLVNDIYLNTEAGVNDWNLWESNKAFTGTFDGDGHTIYNMEEIFDKGADNSGAKNGIALIPTAANAAIKNLHLRGVEVNSWTTTGTAALVGLAAGNVNIEGCSITDANIGGRRAVSAFVGKTSGEVAVTVKDSVLADSVLTKHYDDAEYYAGAFVGNGSTATNITLTDVVAKGYVAVGASAEGAVVGTNDYAIVSGGDYADVASFKAALANGTAQLSTEFYYDYLSGNLPMLKDRLATQNVDIDGNEGADLDADDALALKNILLYGSDAQLTLSEDNANGYNDLAGVDITDLVTLLKKNN